MGGLFQALIVILQNQISLAFFIKILDVDPTKY